MHVEHLALGLWLFLPLYGQAGIEERADYLLRGAGEHLLEQNVRLALEHNERIGPGVGGQPDPLLEIVQGVQVGEPRLIDRGEDDVVSDEREAPLEALLLVCERALEHVDDELLQLLGIHSG